MVESNKVNISAKKTEAGWAEANDNSFLSATPIWFDWLEWITILGIVQVVADKTQDQYVKLISSLSYAFLAFYLFAFFYRFEFVGIPCD